MHAPTPPQRRSPPLPLPRDLQLHPPAHRLRDAVRAAQALHLELVLRDAPLGEARFERVRGGQGRGRRVRRGGGEGVGGGCEGGAEGVGEAGGGGGGEGGGGAGGEVCGAGWVGGGGDEAEGLGWERWLAWEGDGRGRRMEVVPSWVVSWG